MTKEAHVQPPLLYGITFEHYGSVSVARAQYICIGQGARSRFRSVRSEMKSTVGSSKGVSSPRRGREGTQLQACAVEYSNSPGASVLAGKIGTGPGGAWVHVGA